MKTKMARNLPTQIVWDLGSRIISGEIPSGSILTSDNLEAQFGVSRTVVREALRVLHDKGMTRARTKTGTIVLEREEWNLLDPDVISWFRNSGLAQELLQDLEEVRASYEPWVARIAARRRGSKDIEVLSAALKSMTDAYDRDGMHSSVVGEADMAFHQGMLDATQNELMKRIGTLFIPLLRIREEVVRDFIDDGSFILQHKAVLEAIIAEDPDGAELAMRTLLENAARTSSSARDKTKK